MEKVKIALGCDYVGFELKEILKEYLVNEKNAEIVLDPIQRPEDGYESSARVTTEICEAIQRDECRLALLICGTGIGFCHMANTFWGIRACTVSDTYSAKRARLSADAQVLCLGARVVAPEYAKLLVDAWYDEPFHWDRETSVANKKQFEEIDNIRLKKPDFLAWNMGFSKDE
ncbi:MAG: RpiB/LacA/LacB family sugar-phosphate isomerase [Blautia sp.]|jgi:ribose 5-phosphate isomerase B